MMRPYGPPAQTVMIGSSVRQALRAGRHHKWLFLACFFSVLIVGLAVVCTLPSRYSATTVLAISQQIASPLAASQAQPQDDDPAAMIASMLKSKEVAAAMLVQYPPPPARRGPRDVLCSKGLVFLCRPSATAAQLQEAQIDGFLADLIVSQEGQSAVMDVTVTAPTAQGAASMANGVVQAYEKIAMQQHAAQAAHVSDWLNQRTSSLRLDWLNAVQSADAYSIAHNLTMSSNGTTSGPLIDQQIGEVAASLDGAQAELINAKAQAASLQDASRHGDPLALVPLSAQPVLVADATTLLQLKNTRDQLSSEFGPDYPKIQALDQQIATTQAELNAQAGNALASIGENLIAATTKVQQLTTQLAQLRTQAVNENGEESQYLALTAEAASAQAIYAAFLQHADEVADRTSWFQSPVNIISAASVPLYPIFPNRIKLGIGIMLLAIVAGMGAALLREYSSQSFGQAADLRTSTQLPVLAMLPWITPKRGETLTQHVLFGPHSRTSEAIRGIAATLSLLAGDHAGSRTVLVTSAGALEGKSTLATWLAVTAQQTGQATLLVDGDHRRGSLMQIASESEKPGLTELLAGTASINDVIQIDPLTQVSFIAAGTATARSFCSADIARLRTIFNALKTTYSFIVIDSPPLLAMADGLVLGNLADQTLFITRWKHSSRQAVVDCLDRLRTYGARVAGIVVTMVEPNASRDFGGEYGRQETLLINRLYGS